MITHLINDLGMQQTCGDPALYYWKDEKGLAGITGMCVEDLLNAGNEDFQRHTEAALKLFQYKSWRNDTLDFFGAQIESPDPGTTTMAQRYYARTLKPISIEGTFEDFRRERALFSWMNNTRPDVACIDN